MCILHMGCLALLMHVASNRRHSWWSWDDVIVTHSMLAAKQLHINTCMCIVTSSTKYGLLRVCTPELPNSYSMALIWKYLMNNRMPHVGEQWEHPLWNPNVFPCCNLPRPYSSNSDLVAHILERRAARVGEPAYTMHLQVYIRRHLSVIL